MTDNVYDAQLNVDLNTNGAEAKAKNLESALDGIERNARQASDGLESLETSTRGTASASGTAAKNARSHVQSLDATAKGAQRANDALTRLSRAYRDYARAQMAAGKVPAQQASWLATSASVSDRNLALGSVRSNGAEANLAPALEREASARDRVAAAARRQREATRQLLAESNRATSARSEADTLGRVAAAQEQVTRARRSEAAQLGALTKAKQNYGVNSDQALRADEKYASSISRRIAAVNNLRSAEEAQARVMAKSVEDQARANERNQKALTNAQGRLQAENEAEAYRKLEANVGRAEAAKRRLVMAQRAVNAAQDGLKGATGDIVTQIAATERLTAAKRRLAQAETAARAAQQPVGNMDSTRYALYDVGATAGIGAAIGGLAVGAAVKNFATLETQFATVSRTSEETGHNLGIMTDRLLDMGSQIPIPLQGLTDMAARAAQLGVEGQKDILAFTEVMSKFAAISDTVTETEVAEYFGRLNNLTGNMGNWEEMADAVARVGITSAATDQQVLKTAQEIAQAGAGANYSQKEIIGLAGAFASLAVPPERARSVLLDLNKIMTKGMGESTESMKSLSKQMGVSEEAIRGMWRAKPTELISEMAKSLKDMEPEEVMTFLSDFGLKGARALPVFMAIAKDAKNAGEGLSVFDKAQHEAANSAGELDKQFSITMETLGAAWQTFVNSVQAGGFEAMNDIGPILTDILNGAGDLIDWTRDFLKTPIGQFAGNAAIGFTALGTGLLGAASAAAIFGASMLAIKSAAASGIFGSGALATRIAGIGGAATKASGSVLLIGESATRAGSVMATKTTGIQGAMNRTAATAGRAVGTMGGHFGKAVDGLGKVGGAALALAGGPVGAALLLGTATVGIATAAANAQASYQGLGEAITAIDEVTGKSMNTAGIFDAAEQNLRANYGFFTGVQDIFTGMAGIEDPWEFDVSKAKQYLSYVEKGQKITTQGTAGRSNTRTITGIDGARNAMGLEGEIIDTQFAEIGRALSEMSSADASVAFKQLADDLGYTGENAAYLVQALGGPFSDAMWEAGTASGALSGEMGKASQNTEIASFLFKEYTGTAGAAKDAITQMNPALEDMAEGFQGAFAGMSENAQYMNSLFGGMIAGAASVDSLKAALEGLGGVDIYDETTGQFNLTTEAARNALGALSSYGEAQVAAISSNYSWLESMVGPDEALKQTQASMDSARETFIQTANDMGIQGAAAEALADKIGLIPGSKFVSIDTTSSITATAQVQQVVDKLAELPGTQEIYVNALSEEAKKKLEDMGFQVEYLNGPGGDATVTVTETGSDAVKQAITDAAADQNATITVNYEFTGSADNPGFYSPNSLFAPNADGGLVGSARKFANAGFTGLGPKWKPAGTVHAGEYVFPKRAVNQSRGIPTQDALGRMMQQHYPQAVAPSVIVQGGGQSGPIDLSVNSIRAVAQAVHTQVNLDGARLASNTNSHNRNSARVGAA